jgi:hypothetical protein
MRLNNNGLKGTEDLRDLWNQQTPFAIAADVEPLFRKRLKESLINWDMRDGNVDWPPDALDAAVNVYLDDFMLFDVSKPISDTSYLEIEKSTLRGQPYQTGGGRTVNANVIDIMITWMVNNDRKFMQGRSNGCNATRSGDLSLRSPAKYTVADHRRRCRSLCLSRSSLGSDRPVRRHVASIDCQGSAHRRRYRSVENNRNNRWQADHRTPRQCAETLSLHQRQRNWSCGLHGNVRRQG